MISQILISPSLSKRQEKVTQILAEQGITIPHTDLLFLDDEEKLGVEQVKQIREFLSIKPYQVKGRAVVVISASKLTPDAQNAFLKTLEEPPEEAIIILGVNSKEDLLPTIISRCQLIYLSSEEKSGESLFSEEEIKKVLAFSIPDRFTYIEKLEDKEKLLYSLQHYFRAHLKKTGSTTFIKELLMAESFMKANGNGRAILEYLMLKLPVPSIK